ncbi:MAG: hypothetical protein WC390_09150 [Sulfurimonas sp.]|jgi:hypothetical protein
MTIKLKYVMYEDEAVVFGEGDGKVQHNQMILEGHRKPISAGFVFIYEVSQGVEITAMGDSVSLGLKSRPEDTDIIRRTLLNIKRGEELENK